MRIDAEAFKASTAAKPTAAAPAIPPNTDPVSLPAPTQQAKTPDESKAMMEKLAAAHPERAQHHGRSKKHGHRHGPHHGHAYGKLLAAYKKNGPTASTPAPVPTDPSSTDPAPSDPAPADPTDPAAAIDTEA
jgi:hypothetical protein